MRRSEVELGNTPLTTFSQTEDFAALDIYYEWITRLYWEVSGYKRLTKNKLERHNQEGFGEDGTHLGRSSFRQTRMASECGPVRPPGCEMNQGQGYMLSV